MNAQLSLLTEAGSINELAVARQQRDAGMESSLDHAEENSPGWSRDALDFIYNYALMNAEFTGYMVVMASELDKEFPTPPTAKSFGAIFVKAARLGWIKNSGRYMPHPKRHACPAVIWRSLIYRASL